MRVAALSLLTVAGCHLIGGAGDLEFRDRDPAPVAGESEGGGGAAGATSSVGSGGGPTVSCDPVVCGGPCRACDGAACAPAAAGESCGDGRCDGEGACVEVTAAATTFGSPAGFQQAYGVVPFGDDRIVVGSTAASFTWGGEAVAGSASGDAFAIRIGDEARWARSWGDGAVFQAATAVAATTEVFVAGHYQGSVSGLPSSIGGFDGFVFALDPDDGTERWAKALGGAGDQLVESIAAGGSLVAVGGWSSGGFSVGALPIPSGGGPFVVVFAPGGDLAWDAAVEGGGEAVAVATDGDTILFAGSHAEGASIDGTSLGAAGGFAVGYDALGTAQWVQSWPAATVEAAALVGGPVVAGRFAAVAPGGMAVDADEADDVFVAHLDAAGEMRWSTALPVEGGAVVTSVAGDAAGRIYVAGSLAAGGRLQVADGWLDAADEDGFVVVLASDGTPLGGLVSGAVGLDRVAALSSSGPGMMLCGWTEGPLFGADDPSDLDGFVASM